MRSWTSRLTNLFLDDGGLLDLKKVLPLIYSIGTASYYGIGQYIGKAHSMGKEVDSRSSILQEQLIFPSICSPYIRNVDRRTTEHRALCLADAAANAEFEISAGAALL